MTLNLILPINEIDTNNIIYYEKQKNNVMQNSDFYKLIYSDEYSTLNGIFFSFIMKDIYIDKYFNKLKCNIGKSFHNKSCIENIHNIEKKILSNFNSNFQKYKPNYRIYEQLNNWNIKLQNSEIKKFTAYKDINFFIKISGIWCSNDTRQCGLTFKFFIQIDKI